MTGVVTDVSDPASVERLADAVFDRFGACHVLWNNAGVTSGGGGNPWEQEPNDWRWCFGVNVFGTANGVLAFVPRMIDSGKEGVVVTTSSGDGGIAPVPYASVYASSKAAISCLTEALAHQFVAQEHQPVGRPSSTRRAACSRRGCGRPSGTGRPSWPGCARARPPRARRSPSSRRRWPPLAARPTPWTSTSSVGSLSRGSRRDGS